MSVEIVVRLNGAAVPVMLDEDALAAIAVAAGRAPGETCSSSQESPYLTIPEAADYLRCARQRVDDLLSSKRLTRVKDGNRTLISRAEIEEHLRRQPRKPL